VALLCVRLLQLAPQRRGDAASWTRRAASRAGRNRAAAMAAERLGFRRAVELVVVEENSTTSTAARCADHQAEERKPRRSELHIQSDDRVESHCTSQPRQRVPQRAFLKNNSLDE